MRSIHVLFVFLLMFSLACGSDDGSSSTENNSPSNNDTMSNNFDPDEPGVVSFDPEDGATDVALDVTAVVTFSEAMDPETINFDTVFIEAANGKVRAALTVDGATVTLRPEQSLDPLTEYDIVVLREVADPDGNNPASARRAAFTTGEGAQLEAMGVSGTNPEDGARDIGVNTQISITYTSNVDPETVDSNSFRVVDSFDNPVEGEFLVDELNIFFTPSENLDPMQLYTVTITDDVRSTTNKTGGHTWSFTTVPAIEFVAAAPADDAEDADIDSDLILTLSSETDLESSTNDTIVIHAETYLEDQMISRERVMADFSVAGNTIIVEPQDGRWREYRTVYRVEIDGVLSSAGAPLPSQEIQFTTTMFDDDYVYTVVNEDQPRALAADGSSGPYADTAVMVQDASDPSARWGFDREDDGSYLATSVSANLSLSGSVVVDTGDPTTVVELATTDDADPAQRWHFDEVIESNGSASESPLLYRIENQQYDTHSLGILDLSGAYRAYMVPDQDTDEQLWRFENVGAR